VREAERRTQFGEQPDGVSDIILLIIGQRRPPGAKFVRKTQLPTP
jgi:hypothetical protein